MTDETSTKTIPNANCAGAFRCWVIVLLIAGTTISTSGQTDVIGRIGPSIWRLGQLEHFALVESSGLAATPNYPGIYWTHNDTEDPPFLFAITRDGKHIGAYEVKGAAMIDWEATTFDEAGRLYLADIGTNGLTRTHSAIHRVEEPDLEKRWGPARVTATWFLRFPGEREDCEAFFISEGFGYLIGKYPVEGLVPMYRFSLEAAESSVALERVASIPTPGRVSDAALSPDKRRMALVTSEGVVVIFINGNPLDAGSAPRRTSEFKSAVVEGGTFLPEGILVTGESREVLLFGGSALAGAPVFETLLLPQTTFEGGRVEFAASAIGFPTPTYEWRFNGMLLTNQTEPTLTLTGVTLESAGVYELTAANAAGVARTSASLVVVRSTVDLRITEVMSSELPGTAPTADWWELTSFDFREVDLAGWRFNDSLGGLEDAFVIPPGVTIRPGESIVFVENLTPDQFKLWWGSANFAPDAKIFTFTGSQLSFRATGDSLRLWAAGAADDQDIFARVDFGVADFGVSFGFDPRTGAFGMKSEVGVNGAFRAGTGADIGSPGRIRGDGPTLQSSVEEGGLRLRVLGGMGERLIIESSSDLSSRVWRPEGEVIDGLTRPIENAGSRFFRVRRND